MKQGIPEIDKERCKGCGLCIANCPKNILEMANDINSFGAYYTICSDESQCIACGACSLMCPDAAIEIILKREVG
ncbi:MAG: 2-oxoacid:acceptor oxidoreductase [Spirochaeta sp. LUC14_002_19_P3]|nr:MAG: 2-oxoacid:acceptor oxidoreductase [Spirochaeta sp. LUC14_002_19_P3]